MNNTIMTLVSSEVLLKDMVLNIQDYNALLLYIGQLQDPEVKKKYDTIIISSTESIYEICKKQLEINYNTTNIDKSIVDDLTKKIIDALDSLGYKIKYKKELREAC